MISTALHRLKRKLRRLHRRRRNRNSTPTFRLATRVQYDELRRQVEHIEAEMAEREILSEPLFDETPAERVDRRRRGEWR